MSSPLPYAPYHSHRRGASSASSFVGTPPAAAAPLGQNINGASSSITPSSSTSFSRGVLAHTVPSPPASPRESFVRHPSSGALINGSSHLTQTTDRDSQVPTSTPVGNGPAYTTNRLSSTSPTSATASSGSAPPPLRKASALRAPPSSKTPTAQQNQALLPNDKGKGGTDHSQQGASSSSRPAPSAVPSSSLLSPPAPVHDNGSNKRHSYTPSPSQNLSSRGHARTASNSTLPPSLPHHISTAQRLRTSNATPTSGSSATSSPTETPRSRSPASVHMPGQSFPQQDLSFQGHDDTYGNEAYIGRRTAYRPGFQPKGTYRVRTDEFVSARSRRRQGVRQHLPSTTDDKGEKVASELELQRLERRLEKLITLHYETPPVLSEETASERAPTWLPGTIRKARIQAEEDKLMREEEMQIVKWEDDSRRKTCAVCSNVFSLTVRKHHCRLCGRIVCASPHLSMAPSFRANEGNSSGSSEEAKEDAKKCSGLVIADLRFDAAVKIRDVPRWDEVHLQGGGPELRRKAIRICRTCRETIMHRQYMLDDGPIPPYLKHYDTLMSLQREIEQSLPEFQEMVLGLQKQDATAALGTSNDEVNDPLEPPSSAMSAHAIAAAKAKNRTALALQRDAAQARKQLLANFANYDLVAKKIRNLDDGGNASLSRLKFAIWTRANMFLQSNMFPLQNLPKLSSGRDSKTSTSMDASTASSKPCSKLQAGGERDVRNAGVDARARDMATHDPEAARESLAVLEQQLGLVRQYATSASKARKLQDAGSLQASARDLEVEIARLRQLGVS